jgi:hypothetical protein
MPSPPGKENRGVTLAQDVSECGENEVVRSAAEDEMLTLRRKTVSWSGHVRDNEASIRTLDREFESNDTHWWDYVQSQFSWYQVYFWGIITSLNSLLRILREEFLCLQCGFTSLRKIRDLRIWGQLDRCHRGFHITCPFSWSEDRIQWRADYKGCCMGHLDHERARGARLRSSGHMWSKRISLPWHVIWR